MHPFYEQTGATDVSRIFWHPLKQSFTALHRRPDVFFAGANDVDGGESLWVCEMGHLLGGFDRDWMDIPATGRMCFLRYAEFHKFDGETIVESAFFMDVLGVMKEAGVYPLPPMTGASLVQPGPRTHDGLLYEAQAADETAKTIELVKRMIADLDALNKAVTIRRALIIWHVAGMKICFGLARPALEPALPLKDIRNSINYPSARIWATRFITGTLPVLPKVIISAFGWPNLNNKNRGGFLGLPISDVHAEMRVVDIFRREGDKLAENWVFIDLLHYLSMQGLDVLKRMRETRPPRNE